MANAKHVELVRKGAQAIGEWRRANPGVRLDLSGADMSGANLSEAKLGLADLTDADLSGADLSAAKLSDADLWQANLSGANLSRAYLRRAALRWADLSGANLDWANLNWADLLSAKLDGAVLHGASLYGANLTGAYLSGADLSSARLGETTLGDADLSHVIGLATVIHGAPSSVGVDTLIASVRGAGGRLTRDLKTFFRAAGVPKELLDKLREIAAEVKYYSCFICYGEPDVKLAERLTNSLRARGASCWWHPKDATPGKPTWREIGTKRREAERMVVLCSAAALVRDPVLKEIEEQMDEDPDKLVPISLDDLWKAPGFRVARGTGSRDLKPFLIERNWADFHKLGYKKGLERLLVGLRRKARRRRKSG
jgi:hypothetical protein